MTNRILILGYGNPDREDDGVAWHILAQLAQRLGQQVPSSPEDPFDEDHPVQLLFSLQLTPEMAETIAAYDFVWFVDAHTGRVPEDLHAEKVLPEFQNSPFTHHLTPQSCLSMAQALYHKIPPCELVSVRGFAFGFHRELSPATAELSTRAADYIYGCIQALNQSNHKR